MSSEREVPLMSWPAGEDAHTLRQRLLDQRIVLLGGPLDDDAAGDLIGSMLLLSSADPRSEIRLYINSTGGPAGALLAVYDTMQTLSAPVATICLTQARGTAAMLLAAGAIGKRLAFEHSTILLRLPDEHLEELGDVHAQVQVARRRRRSLIEIIRRRTEVDEAGITAEQRRGLLLTAHEAKQHGVVDAVIDRSDPYFVRFPLPPRHHGNGG